MEISDQELRALVREAIERQGRPPAPPSPLPSGHASHARLTLVTGGDPDGRCLIEPSVFCTHCGYCQSMGH